ncbi:hypothetical protein [Campylobacter concisus]
MKNLTKKEIDQYCRTVIHHLIDAYDSFALDEAGLSQDEMYAILARMKYYASKYVTDHTLCNNTDDILNSVRKKREKDEAKRN